mmetsp:Transcript_3490/g.5650  ORF Transcript_3490/g.5650 Transcript_3490/m.5650 type:complete len:341 (+) Transcript_3490:34-1056(+)
MMARWPLLALMLLHSLPRVEAAIEFDLANDVSISLNLLQVQAQAHNSDGGVGQATNHSTPIGHITGTSIHHPTLHQVHPRQVLQPKSSMFRMLEQNGVSQGAEDGIAVIVPGLGDYERAQLVLQNIAWLKAQNVPFECTIYVYLSADDFPLVEKTYAPCRLIRHPGYWMEHIKAFPLKQTRRRWVLHMMDSIKPDKNVHLRRMIDIMKANDLGHAAPTFHKHPWHPVMVSQNKTRPGRDVSFIELQMDVFSRDYFACMQDAASDENGMGWGIDMVLPALCQNYGKMGLFDGMTVRKKFWGSYNKGDARKSMTAFLERFRKNYPDLWLADDKTTHGVLKAP